MTIEQDDRALVGRLLRREPGAFDELYRRHRGELWRFLCRLSGSESRAQDLFQETWFAAARHVHRLREDTRLLPWLYTIARNKQRNAVRLQMFDARRKQAASEPSPSAPSPDREAEVRAAARAIEAAFPKLAEAHREVLLLSVVEGFDTKTIAQALGLREAAVRKRLSRARAELSALAGFNSGEIP